MSEVGHILERLISAAIPNEECGLFLSGGVDSLSCGFAATALGKRVHAYTFQLGEQSSVDSRSAERAARLMGWQFTLIKVPIESDILARDFITLRDKYACVKKTQFECTWPFLYIVPQITERYVLSGIAADGHFGLSKKAMIHFQKPKALFDQFRRDYFQSPNPAGQVQQKRLLEEYGKTQVAPYLDQAMFDYFIQFDWNAINKPAQKILTLRAYPEWFNRVGRRPHENLQLVAGIDQHFEQLLKTPLNIKSRRRMLDFYRDHVR